jgi:hypothetical protein
VNAARALLDATQSVVAAPTVADVGPLLSSTARILAEIRGSDPSSTAAFAH